MIVLHLLELFVRPPAHLPDLYAALFSIFGALNLCVVYLIGVCWLWALPTTTATGLSQTTGTGKDKNL